MITIAAVGPELPAAFGDVNLWKLALGKRKIKQISYLLLFGNRSKWLSVESLDSLNLFASFEEKDRPGGLLLTEKFLANSPAAVLDWQAC